MASKNNKFVEEDFNCPVCGNPLYKNKFKDVFRCKWCKSLINQNGYEEPSKVKTDGKNTTED